MLFIFIIDIQKDDCYSFKIYNSEFSFENHLQHMCEALVEKMCNAFEMIEFIHSYVPFVEGFFLMFLWIRLCNFLLPIV